MGPLLTAISCVALLALLLLVAKASINRPDEDEFVERKPFDINDFRR
jgi:hypothetical protein